MANKSLIEAAYETVKEKGVTSFQTLCQDVCKRTGMDSEEFEKKVGSFYSYLILDGRFLSMNDKDNSWDLKNRYTFDDVKKQTVEFYNPDTDGTEEEDDETPKDLGEEKEEDFLLNNSEDDDDENLGPTSEEVNKNYGESDN